MTAVRINCVRGGGLDFFVKNTIAVDFVKYKTSNMCNENIVTQIAMYKSKCLSSPPW